MSTLTNVPFSLLLCIKKGTIQTVKLVGHLWKGEFPLVSLSRVPELSGSNSTALLFVEPSPPNTVWAHSTAILTWQHFLATGRKDSLR